MKTSIILPNYQNRDKFWDVFKGLGIIAVVMGHADIFVIELNWFHLAIFFFASGYLFKVKQDQKYSEFFSKKFTSIWIPFCVFNIIFIILNNCFLNIHFIDIENSGLYMRSEYYGLFYAINKICRVFLGGEVHVVSGATWFIPPFLLNILMFGFIIKYIKRSLIQFIFIVLLTIIGFRLVKKLLYIPFGFEISLYMMPITYIGYLTKIFLKKYPILISTQFIKYSLLALLLVSSIGIFCYLYSIDYHFSLAGRTYVKWFQFIGSSLMGCVFLTVLSLIILKIKYVSYLFCIIGFFSFEIMALHLFGFRIVNLIYFILVPNAEVSQLSQYIIDRSLIWKNIDVILGIIVPVFIMILYKIIANYLKNCKRSIMT